MPQNEYMERWRKLHGRRLDHEERLRKREAREGHSQSEKAQNLTGLRAKLYQKKRRNEKIQMKKQIKAHEERNVKSSAPAEPSSTPLPQYLLDRSNPTTAKALSSANERFIRPMALRYKKANVTHPELGVTVQLPIISVKKNPQNPMYTQLGVLTKGTIVEVNVSELGMVTAGGKVVWGRWAQITNTPENDGCINAVLLV
ncbi:hypothetical protein DH86_00002826 [Scytalidium sp. 3C]|nr:hypothetical protein DH86_00002826 [Scytalidium sp. 3C]